VSAWLASLDRIAFAQVATWRSPWLDELMLAASHVGARSFVWIVIALILFVFPERRAGAWRVLLALALTGLVVDTITKPLVDRPRPYATMADVRVIDARPTTASFPSGHASTAFAGAMATSRVLPHARVLWWMLALTIAISRVYVGVHYPLDILGGALVGAACAWLVLGGRSLPSWSWKPASAPRAAPVRRPRPADE
jgi:undecaprenyl-diphosphatase